ncbi:peptidase M48, Ste24p precursor [Pseudonocardia sp. N23]|nr:peptidase M48, Ste24p precursor [Pseudonocardia sp. N23]
MRPATVLIMSALALTGFGAGPFAVALARRANPALATVLLTALSICVAGATVAIAALTAYVGSVGILPALHPADWSATEIERDLPVPPVLTAAAAVLAVGVLVRGCVRLAAISRQARLTATAVGAMPAAGKLVVVQSERAHAFAVPGSGGRVVVSTGMLRALTGPERRALLAHELAHLTSSHHVFTQLACLAAAINPLMRPVSTGVDLAVERWADAAALRAVGDPHVVAHAIGKAALAQIGPTIHNSLGVARNDVVVRISCLLDARRTSPWPTAVLAAATILPLAGAAFVVLQFHGVVEASELAGS